MGPPIQPPGGEGLERLRALCALLRVHCPWDREQTLESMQGLVAEEGGEVRAAIEAGDWANLREEVGDVLFNLLLLTRIAEERGLFDWDAVCAAEAEKMIRRHPHVFEGASAGTAAEAVAAFERVKAAERRADRGDASG